MKIIHLLIRETSNGFLHFLRPSVVSLCLVVYVCFALFPVCPWCEFFCLETHDFSFVKLLTRYAFAFLPVSLFSASESLLNMCGPLQLTTMSPNRSFILLICLLLFGTFWASSSALHDNSLFLLLYLA